MLCVCFCVYVCVCVCVCVCVRVEMYVRVSSVRTGVVDFNSGSASVTCLFSLVCGPVNAPAEVVRRHGSFSRSPDGKESTGAGHKGTGSKS